jgi:DNA polymerase-3 subunit delta'
VSWQHIEGHDAVIHLFESALRRGRLAHSYLFTGPAGVGKRLFAGEIAKALLCEDRKDDHLVACDRCRSCTLFDAGSHADFFATGRGEDSLVVKIETMRELCQAFALKSARGRGKIAVLDDADDLNEEAANAFLKTLEEPPPGALLLLISTTSERQLPTIRSRCQIVRFAPLAPDLVEKVLSQNGVDDPKTRERLARLSGGSPGQALALADPTLWEFRRTLLKGLAAPRLDAFTLARSWLAFAEEAGKEAAAQRRRAGLVLRLLIDFLRDALTYSVEGQPRLTEPEDKSPLTALADRLDPEGLLDMIERCLEASGQIEHFVQLALVIEALLDSMSQSLAGAAVAR